MFYKSSKPPITNLFFITWSDGRLESVSISEILSHNIMLLGHIYVMRYSHLRILEVKMSKIIPDHETLQSNCENLNYMDIFEQHSYSSLIKFRLTNLTWK